LPDYKIGYGFWQFENSKQIRVCPVLYYFDVGAPHVAARSNGWFAVQAGIFLSAVVMKFCSEGNHKEKTANVSFTYLNLHINVLCRRRLQKPRLHGTLLASSEQKNAVLLIQIL
jgi:hypothetical protein